LVIDEEEEEEDEEEFKYDDGGIAWDALVREDEPAGGATGLTQGLVGPFPHHVGEGTSQGPIETGPSTNLSQEPMEAGRVACASDPPEHRKSSKRSCF
jgi:hypothetical protein